MTQYKSDIVFLLSMITLYALVFPAGAALAHEGPNAWDVVGKNPLPYQSTYPHLDWFEADNNGSTAGFVGTRYLDQVNVAKVQWNNLNRVIIGKTISSSKTDVYVYDYSDCNTTTIGFYTPPYSNIQYGQIGFNICIMEWQGGYFAPIDGDLPMFSERQRRRVTVHEFGHSIGLNHSDSGSPIITNDCLSVMTASIGDVNTCYQPKQHDIDDVAALHPNA